MNKIIISGNKEMEEKFKLIEENSDFYNLAYEAFYIRRFDDKIVRGIILDYNIDIDEYMWEGMDGYSFEKLKGKYIKRWTPSREKLFKEIEKINNDIENLIKLKKTEIEKITIEFKSEENDFLDAVETDK